MKVISKKKKLQSRFWVSFTSLALILFSNLAQCEIAVIVNLSNSSALDAKVIQKIFLGKTKLFPGGGTAVPLDMAEASGERSEFQAKVLRKSAAQMKAYWSKLIFTGKGVPPKDVSTAADLKSMVASDPKLIAYIDASEVDATVKVIQTF